MEVQAVSLFFFLLSRGLSSRGLASRGSPLQTAGHEQHPLSVLRGFAEEKFQEPSALPPALPLPSPSLSGALHHCIFGKPAQTEVMAFSHEPLFPVCPRRPDQTKRSHHTHMNIHDPARQDPSKTCSLRGSRHGRSDRYSEHGSDLRSPSLFPGPVHPPLTIGVCPPGWAGTAGHYAVKELRYGYSCGFLDDIPQAKISDNGH